MGLMSPASGRETDTIVALGSSSKTRVFCSGPAEKNDDVIGGIRSVVCICMYRGPLPEDINCSDDAIDPDDRVIARRYTMYI